MSGSSHSDGLQNRRYRVTGRVQGVGFRYAAQRAAEALGLTGWVRNLPDGDVEAEASGTPEALDAFEQWLHRGPAHANVRHVEFAQVEPQLFKGFSIRR